MIKFVSYSGEWPCLCMGTLVLEIDGVQRALSNCLISGGSTWFTDDWDGIIEDGPWRIDLPKDLEKYEKEILKVVNENVSWGCCGGCL